MTEGGLKPLRPGSHQHFTTCHYHPALICEFHFQNTQPPPSLSLHHVQEGERERESGSSALPHSAVTSETDGDKCHHHMQSCLDCGATNKWCSTCSTAKRSSYTLQTETCIFISTTPHPQHVTQTKSENKNAATGHPTPKRKANANNHTCTNAVIGIKWGNDKAGVGFEYEAGSGIMGAPLYLS